MRNLRFPLIISVLLGISACGSSKVVYQGLKHPKTTSTRITFQEHNIPKHCSAFAHLLMNSKENSLGYELGDAMRAEAMEKGADLVLVGIAREDEGAELDANRFDYYGPEYSYNFNRTWLGWKFGFDEWSEGGQLIGFGANTSESRDVTFSNTMMVQAVFLRCEEL